MYRTRQRLANTIVSPRARIPNQLILKATNHGISFGLWLFHDMAIFEPYHFGKTRRGELVHMCQFSQFTILRERMIEYDMLKAHDKAMVIGPSYLVEKKGGRSGHYLRRGANATALPSRSALKRQAGVR